MILLLAATLRLQQLGLKNLHAQRKADRCWHLVLSERCGRLSTLSTLNQRLKELAPTAAAAKALMAVPGAGAVAKTTYEVMKAAAQAIEWAQNRLLQADQAGVVLRPLPVREAPGYTTGPFRAHGAPTHDGLSGGGTACAPGLDALANGISSGAALQAGPLDRGTVRERPKGGAVGRILQRHSAHPWNQQRGQALVESLIVLAFVAFAWSALSQSLLFSTADLGHFLRQPWITTGKGIKP